MLFRSIHTKYPSQTLISRITLFAICLSFSSPPLHPCRFIRPLSLSSLSFSICLSLPIALSAVMSEIGETIVDMDNNIMKKFDAPANETPILHTKKSVFVVAILLEKDLFKISLLVSVLYLLWVLLSFIELVVLRALLPCL